MQLADSGGIFSNAEVTYRGVTIGRVGQLRLTADGVEVDLELDADAPAEVPLDEELAFLTHYLEVLRTRLAVAGRQPVQVVEEAAPGRNQCVEGYRDLVAGIAPGEQHVPDPPGGVAGRLGRDPAFHGGKLVAGSPF